MERKSRVNRYQDLRSNIDNQPNTTKSDDLYNYSQRLDAIQPQRNTSAYQREDGDLLNQLKADDQAIENLINQNDALMRGRQTRNDRYGMDNQNDSFNFNIGDDDKPTTQYNQPVQQPTYARPQAATDPYAQYMQQQQQQAPQRPTQQPQYQQQPSQQYDPYAQYMNQQQQAPQRPTQQPQYQQPQYQQQPSQQYDPYAQYMNQQQQAPQRPIQQPQYQQPQYQQPEEEPDTDVFATLFANPIEQQYQQPTNVQQMSNTQQMPVYAEPDFNIDELAENNQVDETGNPFLEQAIRDAKNFSIERGDRAAVDTSAAVISDLTGDRHEDTGNDIESLLKSVFDDTGSTPAQRQATPSPVEEVPSSPVLEAIKDDDMDASFFDDEDDIISVEDLQQPIQQYQQVAQPVAEPAPVASAPQSYSDQITTISDLTQQLDKEHILRNDLEQQTKQMKLEMDGLGNEVDLVNKKMNRANGVLNFVLVLLIVVLFLVLGFIVYLALVDRGIIKGIENLPITILPHVFKL